MTVKTILTYPHPVLREPALPVDGEALASVELQQLVTDMTETMYHHPGTVGLAAPQVGAGVRLFVMDSTPKTPGERYFAMINPVIVEASRWKYSREGCLSFPNYLVTVKRARKITVEWLSPEGQACQETFQDFEAIIIQHETDHLDGVLFIDRIQNIEADVVHRQTLAPVEREHLSQLTGASLSGEEAQGGS